MKGKKTIVAVIPARGGSKGLPGKNIKLLHGKPLIAYTIEAALESKVCDRVIVSTDSEEIAKIAKKHGAEVPFKRPAHFATDTAHTPPVIEHAINYLEKKDNYPVDIVVTLQPTSPLRNHIHVREAVKQFLSQKKDSLISVTQAFPPYWTWKIDANKVLKPVVRLKKGVDPTLLERQQLPKTVKANGAIYICKREKLRSEGKIVLIESCTGYEMDEEGSLDVDTPMAFKIIEMVMNEKD